MFQSLKFLVTQSYKEWREDNASRLAASLSYYTIFSIPPLLIIAIAIAAQLFDKTAVQTQILDQITGLVGKNGADAVAAILENSSRSNDSFLATIISVVTLLLGASGVFGALHSALNTIWEVQPKPGRGILGTLKDRFLSFTMVLGVGFLLMVSLILSSVLAAFSDFVNNALPSLVILAQLINFIVSFGIITILFGLIYKVVPDVKIAWQDVAIGAVVTSLLFTIGKFAIGLYLGNSAPGSTYGAAGSLIVLLLWVYYSAQILFFGAEFTQVYANKFGSRIVADEDAIGLTPEARRNPDQHNANERFVYKPDKDAKTAVVTQAAISRPVSFLSPATEVAEPSPTRQAAERWANKVHHHVVKTLAIGWAGWQFVSRYLFKRSATQS
ncbi:MAG: YihY/virulence factor BrkB family protein [Anaerolineales bacterium]|nr:YihY/virulence factor BrkB family protein [Anaerolineales bacterium]